MAMMRIFWGFLQILGPHPLQYLSSRSAIGFKFAEIFVIEKQLPDSASRGVGDSPTRRFGESLTLRLGESGSRGVGDSPTRLIGESLTPRLGESESRHGESGSRYSNFLKFIIDFPDFERLNQPFKRSI